jgi:hypothetical protein
VSANGVTRCHGSDKALRHEVAARVDVSQRLPAFGSCTRAGSKGTRMSNGPFTGV